MSEIKDKVQEMISASSCCAELRAVGQAWLDAVGTDKEASATTTLLAEIEEDVASIDWLIAWSGSDACVKIFGEEGAVNMLAHAKEVKANGGLYCDCAACTAALEVKELLK